MRQLRAVFSGGNRLHRKRPCRWLPLGRSQLVVWSGDFRFVLTANRGRGIWLTSVSQSTRYRAGHVEPLAVYREPIMKKRTAAKQAGDAAHLAAMETERFKDLLPLVEHCATRKYDDGDLRETGWFTIKTQGAAWIVQVKDPDTCCTFSAVAESLDKALETAALLLSADEAPWEPDSFLTAAAARKKKK